ncbi:MAG: ATP-binding cassette domain-containing protein [Calditrichaeota bacterium]|nr:MAG: ATP-binding cassette domain-containing protein [Calditrichota bacterium]MBL1207741.1 ATP-binding cassette domain-containing protein [Calditrichota bacterium]NOG47575.1 ATP-binding cassette domain-containing protein [Calditrichota bacterium]
MAKKITSFLQRKVFISMLFLGLSLLGFISYKQLQLELLPIIELPYLIVQIGSGREMDPDYLEREALIPLESAVGTLEDVDKIESYAGRRFGSIFISYRSTTNMKYAFLKLQEKVDGIKASLAADFFVQVIKIDTQDLSNMFMNLQVRGSGGIDRIRTIIDKEIKQEFESIDGIANVEVFGGQLSAVNIVLDNQQTEAYGITPGRIRSLIAQYRQSTTYIGQVNNYQLKNTVNVIGDYTRIHEIENIVVDAQRNILLKDIADITFDLQEETSISRVNSKEAVTMQLVRDTQVNLISLSHETHSVIERLNKTLAQQDIEIVVQQDSAEILEDNIDLIIELAFWGGILAIIILWYFLRNLRLVLIIAVTIPVSVLTAFNVFYAYDITLNSLTLVGIALAIGMLLDNSVVVLENIYRNARKTSDFLSATKQGTMQMARSVSASTLTTIAIFLPFLFADEYMIRTIGFQIGVSIISTLLISLIVALILIPMAAHYFLSRGNGSADSIQFSLTAGKFLPFYNLILKTMLRYPARTIIITVVIFVLSVVWALLLGMTKTEDIELEDFNLYVTMPEGATLESTDLAVQELEGKFTEIEELQDVVSQIYEQEAVLTLKLKEDYKEIDDRSIADVKEFLNEIIDRYRTADVSFEQPDNSERFSGRGGGGGGPGGAMGGGLMSALGLSSTGGKIIITGKDFNLMRVFADDVESELDELSSISRIRNNATRKRPEIHLLFDREQLSRLGITLSTIASELSSFQSEISTGMSFKDGLDEYDIVIRNANLEEKDRNDLEQLNIQSQTGAVYPLGQISEVFVAEGSAGINRVNQERRIELSFYYLSEINSSSTLLEAAQDEVEDAVASVALPSGIAIQIEHDEVDLGDFKFLFIVAFILIFMILSSVFESLVKPFIIMFTIPLAATGSLWAIIFTGNTIANVNVLIGLLILLGIVVNNGIILIDYSQQLRRKGMRMQRAIMLSGQARLRPIIITALTTIVAMIPLALGEEQYVTRIAAPFAIAVIGGLSLSTVFTLVFIPTIYSGLENSIIWFKELPLVSKLIQAFFFIVGATAIYLYIESWIWQFALYFALGFIIPGLTYFIANSLRQAKSDYIKSGESITIEINNVYKMYELPGRFLKEWKRKKERNIAGSNGAPLLKTVVKDIWKFIIWGFSIYFVYFYLESGFWIVVLMHVIYGLTLHLAKSLLSLHEEKKSIWKNRIFATLFWGVPILNVLFIFLSLESLTAAIFMFLIWSVMLIVYSGARKLTLQKIDINKISGRLSGLRKLFYRIVSVVPLLGKRKQPFTALEGVSLKIENGMFGLLGPNGAGKTTLMRIICGVLDQSYGTLSINGYDVNKHREELQGLIGYLPQDFGMYENLTAEEFLNYQAILKNLLDKNVRQERIDFVLDSVHLNESRNKKIGSFSGGMKQRVGIAQTLLHLPRILVVDEPTAGLDPRERIRFRNLLVELSRERVVIFSTHIIEDIASSCDRVAILNEGQLCYLGVPQEMAGEAHGKVWQANISEEKFESLSQEMKVTHHTRMENEIRIRVLSKDKPLDDAIAVNPTLEDAYLWLLKK